MKKLFNIIVIILFISNTGKATHIVGGEISYRCLGNNRFEIFATIYRDCINGSVNAQFDNPAYFGVFNAQNIMVDSFLAPMYGNDTLPIVLADTCLSSFDILCVHKTSYFTTITLPSNSGDFTIVYQRCCRNKIIDNIIIDQISPNVGSTFSILITEEGINQCNSSPKFNKWPPINICAGFNIQFDHSATDIESDSIVYKLCNPLNCPRSITGYTFPTPPPYASVPWKTPTYGLNNMLGSKVPLTIDSKTGFLDGIPDNLGQFVIAICMEEYRKGILLSVTRRDFQYNVGYCVATKAAFFTPSIQCDNLTVVIDNKSQNSSTYYWQFNDPKIPGGGSANIKNPTFTYSDTGSYLIQLIINKGTICEDSISKQISLNKKLINADFKSKSFFCIDTAQIGAENITIDTLGNIKSLKWSLYNNKNIIIDSSFSLKPIFSVNDNQTYKVRLVTYAKNTCNDTIFYNVNVPKNPVKSPKLSITANPNIIYAGEKSELMATKYSGFNYQWEPKNAVSNNTINNPIVKPLVPTTYYLTVSDLNGCVVNDSILIQIRNGDCDDPYIFVPNTFTPNGDGVNDVLYVRGGIVETLDFSIYNRWGQKVFETNDKSVGWDGTFQGELLPNEAFGYILKTKCKNGLEFVKKGNISILR